MITLLELQSAFDLADDNDDGLITFEEAMEAVDSAFSGTQFHGAVRKWCVKRRRRLTPRKTELDKARLQQCLLRCDFERVGTPLGSRANS
jgi:Ca2+-binding EF-hand superfamily protein